MKVEDRCKTTYMWFICTGINVGYLLLNSDSIRKTHNVYKGIYRNFYIILLSPCHSLMVEYK